MKSLRSWFVVVLAVTAAFLPDLAKSGLDDIPVNILNRIDLEVTVLEPSGVENCNFLLFINNNRAARLKHFEATVGADFRTATVRWMKTIPRSRQTGGIWDCVSGPFSTEAFADQTSTWDSVAYLNSLLATTLVPRMLQRHRTTSNPETGKPVIRIVVLFADAYYLPQDRPISRSAKMPITCQSAYPRAKEIHATMSAHSTKLLFVTPCATQKKQWEAHFLLQDDAMVYPASETLSAAGIVYRQEDDEMATFVRRKALEIVSKRFVRQSDTTTDSPSAIIAGASYKRRSKSEPAVMSNDRGQATTATEQNIVATDTPKRLRRLGSSTGKPLRKDWVSVPMFRPYADNPFVVVRLRRITTRTGKVYHTSDSDA